jgi:hypothetical protein
MIMIIMVVVVSVVLVLAVTGFRFYFKSVIFNFCFSTFNKAIMSFKKMTVFNAGPFPHCCHDGTRLCSHWRDNIVFIWVCGGSKLVCEDCHHISSVLRTAVVSKPL